MKKQASWFTRFAKKTAQLSGRPGAFGLAALTIIVWLVTGPIFGYSDTWQLIINTGTTIITFLMVFLIQNTQNRDGRAMQLKLDELIHATKRARDELVDLEDLSDEALDRLQREFEAIQKQQNGETPPRARGRQRTPASQ